MSKILVVDDNSKNIQVLATVLAKNGYEVEYSLRGKEAIEMVKTENFDLILLDIMMPEMDGFETCFELKKIPDKKDIPIIFLTAKTDIESITKGFEIGGVDYITKPFNDKELLKRLQTHLELKNNREKLKEVNIWLEKQVDERTKELNEAKTELEQLNKELLELDKAKTNFLSMISHEIRTPLNGISGFLYLLKKQNKVEGLEKYINPLDHSVRRLENFSRKALMLTEITSCNYEDLNISDVNLRELVLFAINNLSDKINAKGIKFNIENLSPDISVKGDDNYLLKAAEFVLENAIDYSPENSEVTVNLSKNDTMINCQILDNGPGFSKSFLDELFHNSSSDNYLDTKFGLSLAIVKKVMEKHKGELKIRNLEKGADVSLHFNL